MPRLYDRNHLSPAGFPASHRTYAAETLEAACRTAVDDDNWDIAGKDYDSSGEVHITGVWEGAHSRLYRTVGPGALAIR